MALSRIGRNESFRPMTIRTAVVFALMLMSAPLFAQEAKDMKLTDAGFIVRPAETPKQLERLRLLPSRTFVVRRKAAKPYYVYADPDYCKCVFLGSEAAMQAYKDMVGKGQAMAPTVPAPLPYKGSPDNMPIQDMDEGVDGQMPDGDILDYRFL